MLTYCCEGNEMHLSTATFSEPAACPVFITDWSGLTRESTGAVHTDSGQKQSIVGFPTESNYQKRDAGLLNDFFIQPGSPYNMNTCRRQVTSPHGFQNVHHSPACCT